MAADLAAQAASFAGDLGRTFVASLPSIPSIDAAVAVNADSGFLVRPTAENGLPTKIPLFVNRQHLADFDFQMYFALDTSGTFLKNVRTDVAVYSVLDRQALFRLDYRADMHTAPRAHWQFHAERGSLTHLLTLSHEFRPKQIENPHTLSKLHFPVGGERFRPCLEDVIQFLIEECGVDRINGWDHAVEAGREQWRRLQLRTAVRDLQEEAAETLRREGWAVTPPDRVLTEAEAILHRW